MPLSNLPIKQVGIQTPIGGGQTHKAYTPNVVFRVLAYKIEIQQLNKLRQRRMSSLLYLLSHT